MNHSYMWHKNFGSKLFRFVTIHAFDRRTDRQKCDGNTVHMLTQLHGKTDHS